jgi:hypothetical protein
LIDRNNQICSRFRGALKRTKNPGPLNGRVGSIPTLGTINKGLTATQFFEDMQKGHDFAHDFAHNIRKGNECGLFSVKSPGDCFDMQLELDLAAFGSNNLVHIQGKL